MAERNLHHLTGEVREGHHLQGLMPTAPLCYLH